MLRPMAFVETLQRAYTAMVRDTVLLEKAQRIAASYPASARERMLEYFRAGSRRAMAAGDSLENHPATARLVYREAAVLYVAAILVSRGHEAEFGTSEVTRAFEQLDTVRSELAPPPANFDKARQLLTSEDPLVIDRLPESQAMAGLQAIQATVGWLGEATEPRSVKQLKVSRVLRVGLLGTVLVVGLVWLVIKLFAPTNIALHRPATASSVHPNSTALPGGLTDGVSSGSYGAHTNKEDDPWVRVDLQDVYHLNKIKIYNRGDGWFDDCLPLTLEVSENGTDFTQVDKRTTTFGQWSPWTFSAGGKKARFIQVRGARGNFVALSEIEAFGKK